MTNIFISESLRDPSANSRTFLALAVIIAVSERRELQARKRDYQP